MEKRTRDRLASLLVVLALVLGCERQPKDVNHALVDLKSKDAEIRSRAASRLGEVVRHSDNKDEQRLAVRGLNEALNDPNHLVRSAAALALGQIGDPALPTVPALAKRLHDPSEDVRINAAAAIYSIVEVAKEPVPRTKEVKDELQSVMNDENQFVRAHAIRGLIALAPDNEEVIKKISLKLNDSDVGVRIGALNALASAGLKAKPYSSLVEKLLHDSSLTVREKAESTLRSIKGE